MNKKTFIKNLLKKLKQNKQIVENRVIDLKGEWYQPKQYKRWQDEFAKDICGIANAPDYNIGYLIVGVREKKKPHLNNISIEMDEAEIQDILRDQVTPTPKVDLSYENIDGYNILFITIESSLSEMPYFALQKSNNNHYMYIRRGSRTDLCKRVDIIRLLKTKREHQVTVKIEAQALGEIKSLEYQSRRNLSENNVMSLLKKLDEFSEEYNERIKIEVLTILINVSNSFIKYSNSTDVSKKLSSLGCNIVAFTSYKKTQTKPLTEIQKQLLEKVVWLGQNLGYKGARRLQSFDVINSGLELIWRTLRISKLNNCSNIKLRSEEAFETIKKWSREMELADAIKWTDFRKKDALAINDGEIPDYPKDLSRKFINKSST